jgi:hypothetical protein
VDYRRFLAKTEEIVAPVVERKLWLHDRRIAVDGVSAGWWRVRLRGRAAEPLRAATEEEVTEALRLLPVVRGPVLRRGRGWAVVVGGSGCEPIDLVRSDEEPPLLSPLKARRWPAGGLLLWDEIEWEGEAEEVARRALEDGSGLQELKGASAALRAAFAFAAAGVASRALGIAATPAELRRWVRNIAERGQPAAEAALRALAVERATWAARARANVEPRQQVGAAARQRAGLAVSATPAGDEALLEAALRGAGARLLSHRRASPGLIEVRWQLSGERFVSIVEERGLRVVDAGVCLAGSDSLVTLDSLPGVIRQAMDEDALVITRHGWD